MTAAMNWTSTSRMPASVKPTGVKVVCIGALDSASEGHAQLKAEDRLNRRHQNREHWCISYCNAKSFKEAKRHRFNR